MNNGVRHKLVKFDEVDKYLENGWFIGHISKVKLNNKHWITNGIENKRVAKDELEKYYSLGYYSGRTKHEIENP